MIGKLKGIIEEIRNEYIIIDVGGVGYMVFCSTNTLSNVTQGATVSLLIETHVREDAIHLYGFKNEVEKEAFTLLVKIKGVSAKMALSILSSLSPDKLFLAINSGDKQVFKGISGVGGKLASRIITELQGSELESSENNFMANNTAFSHSAQKEEGTSPEQKSVFGDSVEALVSLGINRSEAYSRVSKLLNENPDYSVDMLIKNALKT